MNLYHLPMKSPRTFLSQFFRNCILLFRLPIDFLLTFSDTLEKVPELKEINEESHNLGQKLLKEMKSQMSGGMRAYFIGSNFFKIIGIDNDIDFLVEYATEGEKEKWRKILIKQFGKPVLESRTFTKWEVIYSGFPVEVVLSNPKFRIFRKIFDSYNALYSYPEIRAEYEELKRNSVGVTLREYNRRQLYFFEYYVKNKISSRKYGLKDKYLLILFILLKMGSLEIDNISYFM